MAKIQIPIIQQNYVTKRGIGSYQTGFTTTTLTIDSDLGPKVVGEIQEALYAFREETSQTPVNLLIDTTRYLTLCYYLQNDRNYGVSNYKFEIDEFMGMKVICLPFTDFVMITGTNEHTALSSDEKKTVVDDTNLNDVLF